MPSSTSKAGGRWAATGCSARIRWAKPCSVVMTASSMRMAAAPAPGPLVGRRGRTAPTGRPPTRGRVADAVAQLGGGGLGEGDGGELARCRSSARWRRAGRCGARAWWSCRCRRRPRRRGCGRGRARPSTRASWSSGRTHARSRRPARPRLGSGQRGRVGEVAVARPAPAYARSCTHCSPRDVGHTRSKSQQPQWSKVHCPNAPALVAGVGREPALLDAVDHDVDRPRGSGPRPAGRTAPPTRLAEALARRRTSSRTPPPRPRGSAPGRRGRRSGAGAWCPGR